MRLSTLVFVIVVVSVGGVRAWWCTGHMLIAEIAKQEMTSAAAKKVEAYAEWLSNIGPFDKNPDMMQMACWADDVRYNDRATAQWHYNNEVVNPEGVPIDGCPVQHDNVIASAEQMDLAMRRGNANQWQMAYAVVNYIHFIGDIHQPLHNAELFSKIFPHGDLGGNLFNVTLDGHQTNLHAIWDSVCNEFAQDFDRPLDASSKAFITQKASWLISKWKSQIPASEREESNTTVMHIGSFNDAVNVAYKNIKVNGDITDAYLALCTPAAERRVALGGFRLGNELQRIFGSKAP